MSEILINFNRVYEMSWSIDHSKLLVYLSVHEYDTFDDSDRTQDLFVRYSKWLIKQGMA
jgi:hypothetical protein